MTATVPFADALGVLRAAAEETRLRILVLLGDGELSVSDLTDILGQSQPRISATSSSWSRRAWWCATARAPGRSSACARAWRARGWVPLIAALDGGARRRSPRTGPGSRRCGRSVPTPPRRSSRGSRRNGTGCALAPRAGGHRRGARCSTCSGRPDRQPRRSRHRHRADARAAGPPGREGDRARRQPRHAVGGPRQPGAPGPDPDRPAPGRHPRPALRPGELRPRADPTRCCTTSTTRPGPCARPPASSPRAAGSSWSISPHSLEFLRATRPTAASASPPSRSRAGSPRPADRRAAAPPRAPRRRGEHQLTVTLWLAHHPESASGVPDRAVA